MIQQYKSAKTTNMKKCHQIVYGLKTLKLQSVDDQVNQIRKNRQKKEFMRKALQKMRTKSREFQNFSPQKEMETDQSSGSPTDFSFGSCDFFNFSQIQQ